MPLILSFFLAIGVVFADVTYVVKPGDTLSNIARNHGTTVQAIVEANSIANPNFIFVGQVLVIPGATAAVGDGSGPAGQTGSPAAGGEQRYVVQSGDSLWRIATTHGVTVQSIVDANNLSNANIIFTGQLLVIPGGAATGSTAAGGTAPPAPAATPVPAPAPVVTGANLLPNPSFEEGRYNHNNVEELQVPNGWFLHVDEGSNSLQPGSGGNFFRPESRVLPSSNLPPHERSLFIWQGDHTIKIFKGGAPTSFSLFTDVYLQPGTYRMQINFFPDLVMAANSDGSKVWADDALSGEVRFIVNEGGSNWILPQIGVRNTLTHTFTVSTARSVRVGAGFRNRFVLSNNGWFLDDWSLQRVSN